jgi:dimethylamine---corrinoid protein Co-methyltransferase
VGVGDPLGMHAAHAVISGMGGIRTAGDLVARLQLNRGMRIDAAKKYVADKLGVSIEDLADTVLMSEVREDLDIGRVNETPAVAKGIDAKFRIAELLDLEINCVNMFKNRVGIRSYKSFS